jgi:hypothetical protein
MTYFNPLIPIAVKARAQPLDLLEFYKIVLWTLCLRENIG